MPLSLRDANTRLKRLDDVELSQVCLLYFPRVYAKFSDGMRRDKKIELLLDHLGRFPEELPLLDEALAGLGSGYGQPDPARAALITELDRFEQGLSKPAARTVAEAEEDDRRRQAPMQIRQRFALLIGVGSYLDPGIRDLPLTVQDVLALEKKLAAAGYTVVTLHGDLPDEGLKPTRSNILGKLANLAGNTGPGDLLLVYFGGHGDLDPHSGRPYLLARDTYKNSLEETGIDLLRFQDRLRSAGAQARILLLDACHSGAGRGDDRMSAEFQRLMFQQAEGLAVLASCSQQQLSYEYSDGKNGAFTHFLLEGLAGGERDGAVKAGKFITFQSVNEYVTPRVQKWAIDQGLSQLPRAETRLSGDPALIEF